MFIDTHCHLTDRHCGDGDADRAIANAMAAGVGVLEDEEYTQKNCKEIIKNREYTTSELKKLGFKVTDSTTNFVFASHPDVDGEKLYQALKERGILVRHFNNPRISQYNRITVGTREQMEKLIDAIKNILEGKQ